MKSPSSLEELFTLLLYFNSFLSSSLLSFCLFFSFFQNTFSSWKARIKECFYVWLWDLKIMSPHNVFPSWRKEFHHLRRLPAKTKLHSTEENTKDRGSSVAGKLRAALRGKVTFLAFWIQFFRSLKYEKTLNVQFCAMGITENEDDICTTISFGWWEKQRWKHNVLLLFDHSILIL